MIALSPLRRWPMASGWEGEPLGSRFFYGSAGASPSLPTYFLLVPSSFLLLACWITTRISLMIS